jgi:hypothetical protein
MQAKSLVPGREPKKHLQCEHVIGYGHRNIERFPLEKAVEFSTMHLADMSVSKENCQTTVKTEGNSQFWLVTYSGML